MFLKHYHDHHIFIENVRRLVDTEFSPKVDQWERDGFFPNDVFSILGREGYLGILVSEKFGGIHGGYELAAAWCETFGELCAVGLTTGVNMHSLVISHALDKFGTENAKNRWLPRAMKGEAIGAYAFTEPGAGSDLANIRTKAEFKNGSWHITGSKTFITNGVRAHFILLLARHDFAAGSKGFTTFLIDTSLPGFSVSKKLDKLGWRSSDTAELTLEDVKVDESCVLGKVGDGWHQAAANLNWERLMLTLTSLGGARKCYQEAAKYADDRKAFGKPIREHDAVREMLEEMHARVVTAEAATYHALELLVAEKPCRTEVSAAKRLVCEDAIWIADRAVQIHGGYGYTTNFHAERWWRDLRLMTIGGGTSEIMGNIVSKTLGFAGKS